MLINLRNALMAGKRLPYDAEVEFLESTGTQYINTGVAGTATTGIWLDVYRPSDAVAFGFGAQGSGWGKDTLCIVTGNNRAYWMYGASVSSTYISTSSTLVGRITFESNANVLTTRIGANTISTTSNGTVPFTTPVNLFLFTRPHLASGTVDYTNGICGSGTRIYGATISDNGVILKSFIPVRFTNELGQSEGAMYDRRGVGGMNPDGSPRTDGLYRSQGTGDFVLGPDVVPVEYIESHGTEWIDAEYKHSEPCEYIININGTPTANDRGIFGSYESTTDIGYLILGFYNMFVYGFNKAYTRIDSPTYPAENNDFLISYKFGSSTRTLSVNGWTGTADGAGYNSKNVAVFATGTRGVYPSSIKCRDFKIKNASDETIHNFRPVRVGTDATSWEGAMMDVLTRRIYRNAGTGAFTYGDDLKYPIPAE